jgi:ATP-binding cassette subfamily B multidrug efflux pump
MLGQSMGFYGDEFAGRVSAKVMQTAMAVRDVWMIACDILVFVTIYFVTLVAVLGSFNPWMLAPIMGWLGLYGAALRYFVPRLARQSQALADARSLMTGRITDAYTNIATVKLFAHDRREASHAKDAMQDYLVTVQAQKRLVTRFEVLIHALSMALIIGIAGTALALWSRGAVGVGAVAAATAMALRLNGMSHWIMFEMATLFEHVGTVQDGIATLSQPRQVTDLPGACALAVRQGEIRFDDVSFAYGGTRPPHPDRRPGHCHRDAGQPARPGRHGDAGHQPAAPQRARQHPVRPARCG